MSLADVHYLRDQKEYREMAEQLLAIMEPLIRFHTPSTKEGEITEHILQFVNEKCRDWIAFTDKDGIDAIGNVLVVPKKYVDTSNKFSSTKKLPILMAHMDTNYTNCDLPEEELRERLSAYTLTDTANGNTDGIIKGDPDLILGFDDKAGIALILYLIRNCQDPDFKVLFTVQEEETECDDLRVDGRDGGGGIQYALNTYPEYFDTSLWTIMVDRAEDARFLNENEYRQSPRLTKEGIREGSSDIINWYLDRDTCSSAFKKKVEEISDHLGTPMVSRKSGAKADTYNIRKALPPHSSVNMAAGGYGEHYPGDYLCIYQTVRTLRVVEECIRQQDELYRASQVQ